VRLLCALLLVLSAANAFAEEPSPAPRGESTWVLQPSAAPMVVESFRRAAPQWKLGGASIQGAEVTGTVCLGEGDDHCLPFRLTHPKGCTATLAGPWCLAVDTTKEGAQELPALTAALAATPASVWSSIEAPPSQHIEESPAKAPTPETSGPVLKLLGWLLLPLLLGAGVGLVVRRLRLRALPVVAALLLPLGSVALFPLVPLGFWDLAGLGVLAALSCLWCASSRSSRQGLLLAAMILLLGLAALELVSRRWLPEPARFPSAWSAHLQFSPNIVEPACVAPDTDKKPAWLVGRDSGKLHERERVLHLGDSMVYGSWVEGHEAFPSLLEALDPGVAHINGGVPGAGLDGYLMVERTWIEALHPSRVVVHLFTGNDFYDIDRAASCCEAGPLFEYEGGTARQRCPTPRWTFTKKARLRNVPAPYPLRLMTGFSWAARHAVTAINQIQLEHLNYLFEPRAELSEETAAAHNEALLKALRDDLAARHIPLTVAVIPFRGALTSANPRESAEWRIRAHFVAMAQRLGLPVIDAWEEFEQLSAARGSEQLFITPPSWEVHFNAGGHQEYARWLLRKLGPGLRGAPPASAVQDR
jgi:lysophospholipase L1-like esterase